VDAKLHIVNRPLAAQSKKAANARGLTAPDWEVRLVFIDVLWVFDLKVVVKIGCDAKSDAFVGKFLTKENPDLELRKPAKYPAFRPTEPAASPIVLTSNIEWRTSKSR
jgi:hypothetical protein